MGNTPATHKLLSTGDVARLSGFSPSAVLQWIHSRKLRSYSSPGGQHRVEPGDLLDFLQAHGMRVPTELLPESTRRVLVVEDDRAVRDVLARILNVSGLALDVDTADGGVEGCAKVPVFKPHLVVLDLEIAGFDPVELCRWVRDSAELADTRIMLLASDPNDETLRLAMMAGADEWLIKPVRVMPFLTLVTRLLDMDGPSSRSPVAPAGALEHVGALQG
ncbi:MAG: response regulator [Candidatus Brocadiae bacterium]|nr:response regulator [Candidatus Brocadiia bacterium]